jgi:malonyl-CoA/methylmalonyl-CoA synthetase
MNELPLIARSKSHGSNLAIRTPDCDCTYDELLSRSAELAQTLLSSDMDLNEARVAQFLPAGPDYVVGQWATWRAGGVFVPLCHSATLAEWEYTLADSECSTLLCQADSLPTQLRDLCNRRAIRMVPVDSTARGSAPPLPTMDLQRRAMILYTSGTTNKPKGVVSTHANIQAQIECLIDAWRWRSTDRIPLFLPLHHVHGIINVLCCALWSGATVETFPRFDASAVLERVRADAYTLFMAVPTIYVKLIETLRALPDSDDIRSAFGRLRLMVSGSAALPAKIHQEWFDLTSQKLLERYGMTEIGMALSNPYEGERRPGSVGRPLPGVEVRLKGEGGSLINDEDVPGEIQVRGPSVFREYWNRPGITAESFDEGWFRTGDMAVVERDYYRIMGRLSVDIIKSGGYKLSALEIESILLEHPQIKECSVVGVPDDVWGEAVSAVVVTQPDTLLEADALRAWCKERMSGYKVPRHFCFVEALPRNAMGKVTKPSLRELFETSYSARGLD